MLADTELEAIAARHTSWRKAHGNGKAWHAARLARDVEALLRHIREVTDERDDLARALAEETG
jgi:hypothetical protein